MDPQRTRTLAAFIMLALSVLLLAYAVDRTQSTALVGLYLVSFLSYVLLTGRSEFTFHELMVGAVVLRLALLGASVPWTDDHYRYIWDGLVTLQGVSPYAFVPAWIRIPLDLPYDLYQGLNSANYYSVYPPLVQVWSAASVFLAREDPELTVLIMRTFVFLAETFTIIVLYKALAGTVGRVRYVALYALNPLVLMELTVNLHTEFLMVLCCSLALLAYRWGRNELSAIFLGLAITAKLWPLLFLLLVPGMLGWRRAISYSLTALAVFMVCWLPFNTTDMIGNVFSSVQLYLDHFEYNAPLFLLAKQLLIHSSLRASMMLSVCIIVGCSLFMLYRWWRGSAQFAEGMLWVMLIYFAGASTVHPWYIVPLIAFSVLTRYRWPILWSLLIVPTYLTYGSEPWQQPLWWVVIEYVLLFLFIALELMIHTRAGMDARARVKFNRLQAMLPKNATLLDIGTGNGALAHMLQQDGHQVQTVDVVDKSCFPLVRPAIIKDNKLPYPDHHFEVVLLITVLHHTAQQEQLLKEARRVGRQVVVMEDVYQNTLQRWLTFLFDSLINLEFFGHPHSNRSTTQWQDLFTRLGLRVVNERQDRTLALFLQRTWLLRT